MDKYHEILTKAGVSLADINELTVDDFREVGILDVRDSELIIASARKMTNVATPDNSELINAGYQAARAETEATALTPVEMKRVAALLRQARESLLIRSYVDALAHCENVLLIDAENHEAWALKAECLPFTLPPDPSVQGEYIRSRELERILPVLAAMKNAVASCPPQKAASFTSEQAKHLYSIISVLLKEMTVLIKSKEEEMNSEKIANKVTGVPEKVRDRALFGLVQRLESAATALTTFTSWGVYERDADLLKKSVSLLENHASFLAERGIKVGIEKHISDLDAALSRLHPNVRQQLDNERAERAEELAVWEAKKKEIWMGSFIWTAVVLFGFYLFGMVRGVKYDDVSKALVGAIFGSAAIGFVVGSVRIGLAKKPDDRV